MNIKIITNAACIKLYGLPGFLYCDAGKNELRFCFDNNVDAEAYKSLRLLEEVVRPMKVQDTVLIEYMMTMQHPHDSQILHYQSKDVRIKLDERLVGQMLLGDGISCGRSACVYSDRICLTLGVVLAG